MKKSALNPGSELELLAESVRPLREKPDPTNDARVGAETQPTPSPRFLPLLEALREREQLRTEVERLREKQSQSLGLQGQIGKLRARVEQLQSKERELVELRQEIANLHEKLRQTAELERQIELHLEKERKIPALRRQVEGLQRQVRILREQVAQLPEHHRQISWLRDKERQIPGLQEQLLHKELEIAELHSVCRAAEESARALRSSTSWRLTAPMRWLLDLLRGNRG